MTLSGTISESGTGALLPGVNVYLPALDLGAVTNEYGFYSLSIKDAGGPQRVIFSYLGYQGDTLIWDAASTLVYNPRLLPAAELLSEVRVTANSELAGRSKNIGMERLSVATIKEIPVLLGEKDVFKSLQLLPGVSNPREGFGGLYVRGGSPDQNLILLDGAPVYNAFHLFGFLSVFNVDALQGIDLYKGGFPARYGGRTASVVDVRMREGSREGFHGSGGIGLLAGRLTLEAPLFKDKRASILLSGRRTFADLLLRPLQGSENQTSLYFYDGSAKFNYDLNAKNRLYVSAYAGRDEFSNTNTSFGGAEETDGFNWGNRTLTARWNRVLGARAFLNVTAIYSDFDFTIENQEYARDSSYVLRYVSGIQDVGLRAAIDWHPLPAHTIRVGLEATRHEFTTSALALRGNSVDSSGIKPPAAVTAPEFGLYLEDEFTPSSRLTINYGLRGAAFLPDSADAYLSLEPRLSVQYQLRTNTALRAGYAFNRQYLHLLSNSGPGLPTDLWVAASRRIPPQSSRQFSLGLAQDWPESGWSVGTEVYYRRLQNVIGYRNGASFLLLDLAEDNPRTQEVDVADNVTTGDGRAYGLEVLVDYRRNRLKTRLAYTLARVEHRLADINNSTYFPANQDRRHDINLSGTYQLRRNLLLSLAWTYGSGVPTTLPLGIYQYSASPGYQFIGNTAYQYSDRNAFRLPALHRLDLALQWKRTPRWGEAYWEFGVYNAYARANTFYLRSERDRAQGRTIRQVSLFPVVPSLSYNFNF
ncbi:MAG: TonB-dependent receptor [Saprospiraceae bacterium]